MMERDCILNDLKVGQVFPIGGLEKVPDGHVCILYPYQPYVAESVPESARINAYLKSSGYTRMNLIGHF